MRLADYLEKHEITDAEFASLVGKDRTAVSRWRRDKVRPDWDTLWKIAEVTGGKVTADDFVIDPQKQGAA